LCKSVKRNMRESIRNRSQQTAADCVPQPTAVAQLVARLPGQKASSERRTNIRGRPGGVPTKRGGRRYDTPTAASRTRHAWRRGRAGHQINEYQRAGVPCNAQATRYPGPGGGRRHSLRRCIGVDAGCPSERGTMASAAGDPGVAYPPPRPQTRHVCGLAGLGNKLTSIKRPGVPAMRSGRLHTHSRPRCPLACCGISEQAAWKRAALNARSCFPKRNMCKSAAASQHADPPPLPTNCCGVNW